MQLRATHHAGGDAAGKADPLLPWKRVLVSEERDTQEREEAKSDAKGCTTLGFFFNCLTQSGTKTNVDSKKSHKLLPTADKKEPLEWLYNKKNP